MGTPALPSLVAIVLGHKPLVIPLRHTGGWAVIVPAGRPAYILSPSFSLSSERHSRTEIAAMLREAAKTDYPWFSYDLWSIHITTGAWAHLDDVTDTLIDVLASPRAIVLDHGQPSLWARICTALRSAARWALGPARQSAPHDMTAETPPPRPRRAPSTQPNSQADDAGQAEDQERRASLHSWPA